MAAPVVDVEFIGETPHAIEVVVDVRTGAIVGGTPASGAEVNVTGAVAVTNALKFPLPTP